MERLTALSLLLGRPLLIERRRLEVMLAIASRGEFFEGARLNALEAREGAPLRNARLTTTREGSAIIPVTGPLVRHADLLSEISGATSYATLRKDLQLALDDPHAERIVFVFDTPGGEVTGCAELADAIYAARAVKPTVAYVDGMACSAGMWLASACQERIISPTGEAGSIGVMLAWLDDSAAMEAAGIREIRFVSSRAKQKNADPETDAGAAQYQRIVDDLEAVFIATVARNLGISEEAVVAGGGEGAVLVGARAVEAGLADRIGDFEALLVELRSSTAKGKTVMSVKPRVEENTDDEALKCGGCSSSVAKGAVVYCATCAGRARAEEDPDDEENLKALKKFAAAAKAATKTANLDEALGAIVANAKAASELEAVLEKQRMEAHAATQREYRALLEAAVADGRMSLGELSALMPALLDEETSAAALAAYEKIEEQTGEAVVNAFCSAPVSSSELTRVKRFLAGKTKQEPAAVVEPKHDPKGAKLSDDRRKLEEASRKGWAFDERQQKGRKAQK